MEGWETGEKKENEALKSQARELEADVEHSFAFLMRAILQVLAWLTISKKIFFAFQLEAHRYKWFEGQENWQLESILLVVDTFLNTVEK